MVNQAQQQIEGCKSLEVLQALWVENAGAWKALPKDQAAEIIRLKDRRKSEIETGIYRRRMDSKTIGMVDVLFDTHKPDQVQVGGVRYANAELMELLSRGLDRDEIRTTHGAKMVFDGAVVLGLDEQGRAIS